jgi:hypothetical protein
VAAPAVPIAAVAAAAPAASVAAAVAQPAATPLHPIPDGGLTTEEVVAWLQSAGYSARVVIGTSGEPHIVSSTQGTTFNVFLYDRKGDRCASLMFTTGITTNGKFDISQINDWNSKNRWSRAYYDSVNDPWIETDVDLSPGGTYESLNDQFGTFNNTLARFMSKYSLR